MLHEKIRRKFDRVFKFKFKIEVETDNGWNEIQSLNITNVVDQLVDVVCESGRKLQCSPDHILYDEFGKEIFAKDCLGVKLITDKGLDLVVSVSKIRKPQRLYDLSLKDSSSSKLNPNNLDDYNHTYFANGFVSHNCLVMDEAAFLQKNIADDFFASVFPILSSDVNSKAIMVSTPNGTTNNAYYDTWQQANDPNVVSDENWKPFRFSWYEVPGRDQKWKEQQIATIGMARWLQEFECEFKTSSDASLVPSDSIEHFRMNLKNYHEPAQLNLSKNPDKEITAYFWKPFDPTRVYSSSGDISEGTGNDSSVINIWDVTDIHHIALCARMSCSKATLVDFGYAAYELLKMYAFPPFIVENNGVGAGFVDILLDTYHFPQERMFYEQAITPTGKYGEKTYGVKSKNKTKLDACMFLNELITTPEIDMSIPDELLVNEMGTFVKKNTSNSITFNAKDKCHDDYMMTWIWGMYLLFADTIEQNYTVVKAFKTQMDRVLPERVEYKNPTNQNLIGEIMTSQAYKSIVSQLNDLEDHKLVKLVCSDRNIPDDELYYGNRQWGSGRTPDFFVVNQGMDFMSGEDYQDMEDITYGNANEVIIPGSWF